MIDSRICPAPVESENKSRSSRSQFDQSVVNTDEKHVNPAKPFSMSEFGLANHITEVALKHLIFATKDRKIFTPPDLHSQPKMKEDDDLFNEKTSEYNEQIGERSQIFGNNFGMLTRNLVNDSDFNQIELKDQKLLPESDNFIDLKQKRKDRSRARNKYVQDGELTAKTQRIPKNFQHVQDGELTAQTQRIPTNFFDD